MYAHVSEFECASVSACVLVIVNIVVYVCLCLCVRIRICVRECICTCAVSHFGFHECSRCILRMYRHVVFMACK